MKRIYLLTFVFSILAIGTYSQRNCGAMEYLEHQLEKDPKMKLKMDQIERSTRSFIAQKAQNRVNGVITIPVVVHVVYNNSTENISDGQILSQINVLNEDYRRLNSDADNTWSQADDIEIEFCMATVDPNGNPTNGITRTSTPVTAFGTNDNMKFNSSGGKDAWPASDYLNMWVCDISGTTLGYAQFPGGSPATDGVVMDYQYFGTTGTATAPFDLGRTATHEVGHWMNLRHIWGDGNCNVDDFVTDTPSSDAPNYGCATGHVSCNTVDMVQNYMDYSDDDCMNLFTSGQKTRMRALFDTGGARASLLSSGGCSTPIEPTCTDGIQNGDETGVDCGGATCPDCPPCSNIFVSITFDNYPEETSWVLVNSNGSTVASGGPYGSQPDGSTINETLCIPEGCYDFIISDTYGDGICCSYGNGSYTVSDASGTLASGGSFGSSESTNICIGGGPAPTCNDGIQNGDETGVDCGGSCSPCPTCNDGIQNGDETGVDCGGSCSPCPTCNDGIQNGDETGVDCGGSCTPCPTGCSGTEVTVNITFDNYPGETSWEITNSSGGTVASGGSYSGSSVSLNECLNDGCYTFTIFDSYGDGICCSYGNGSYTVTDASGTLASGGNFGSSESTQFCLGGSSGPTCNDGIQNGDETGIDCGGSCAPCNPGGGCSYANLDFNDFETSYGLWNDGGSDCIRTSDPANAYSGSITLLLRDNTSTSVLTTDNMNLSGYEEVTIDFTYIAQSMETGEDFWLQASTDGGSTYTTLVSWASGTDFSNGVREFETVTITGTFTNATRFRFRCDASSNSDYVYLDDINISGCVNSSKKTLRHPSESNISMGGSNIENVALAPNPTSDILNISYRLQNSSNVNFLIMDVSGRLINRFNQPGVTGDNLISLNVTEMNPGIYYLNITSDGTQSVKKFIVLK